VRRLLRGLHWAWLTWACVVAANRSCEPAHASLFAQAHKNQPAFAPPQRGSKCTQPCNELHQAGSKLTRGHAANSLPLRPWLVAIKPLRRRQGQARAQKRARHRQEQRWLRQHASWTANQHFTLVARAPCTGCTAPQETELAPIDSRCSVQPLLRALPTVCHGAPRQAMSTPGFAVARFGCVRTLCASNDAPSLLHTHLQRWLVWVWEPVGSAGLSWTINHLQIQSV
jgi:hypothetical protein